tara:strand:+ start:2585 stop:3118 length:534 start_codon:yes stop_codon:yes gene_type:complete
MSLKFAFPMSSADGYSQFESGNGIPLILVIELSMQDIESLCNFKHLCPDGRYESFLIESFVGLDMDICEYEAQLKGSAIQYHSCASIDLLDDTLSAVSMHVSPSLPAAIIPSKVLCNQVNLHVNDKKFWLTSRLRVGGETINFSSCSKSLSDLSRLFKKYFSGEVSTGIKRDESKGF